LPVASALLAVAGLPLFRLPPAIIGFAAHLSRAPHVVAILNHKLPTLAFGPVFVVYHDKLLSFPPLAAHRKKKSAETISAIPIGIAKGAT
jgi:hypothetical protein